MDIHFYPSNFLSLYSVCQHSNLCQTKTSENKADRSTMIDNIHKRLSNSSFLCVQLSQLSCLTISSCVVPVQPCHRKHLLRELPIPQGLRSLWRFMTQDADKKTKTFLQEHWGILLILLKGLIWNKLDALAVCQQLSNFCMF